MCGHWITEEYFRTESPLTVNFQALSLCGALQCLPQPCSLGIPLIRLGDPAPDPFPGLCFIFFYSLDLTSELIRDPLR